MMSSTETILVQNQPGRFLSFPDLIDPVARPLVGDADEKTSAVISDVGPATLEKVAGMSIPLYTLRGESKRIPGHLVGNMHMNDAFSFFHYEIVDIPAIGTSVDVQATWTAAQEDAFKHTRVQRGEAIFIIVLDEPLGGNHLLEITAPEVSLTTSVRGVKWKPAAKPVIAFRLPWRNDTAFNASSALRPGHCGMTLKIETLEDNTISGVSVPLKMCVFKCMRKLSGQLWDTYGKGNTIPNPFRAAFSQQATTSLEEPIVVQLQMDAGGDAPDPQAAADSADATSAVVTSTVTSDVPQPAVEKVSKVRPSNPRKQTRKNPVQAISQKWVLVRTFGFTDASLGVAQAVVFDPSELETGGDSLMRAFRKNIYFTGGRSLGFTTLYHFKLVSNRAPQIAGRIMIGTHLNEGGARWVHVFGGAPTEFTAAPTAFQEGGNLVKNRNSPWLKCASQREVTFRMECIQFNRTDAIEEMKVKLFVKPGDIIFQVPIRPRPRTTAIKGQSQLMESLRAKQVDQADLFTIGDLLKKVSLLVPAEEQVGGAGTCEGPGVSEPDVSPPGGYPLLGAVRDPITDVQDIAPPASSAPEVGEFDPGTSADTDDIDQDDFWVCAGEAAVPTNGTAIAFPINMQSVVDSFGNNGPSPMREKFLRYANIIPKHGGQFGPVLGSYTVIPRLPTGISANLAHVCLPNDINEETALRIFGLGSLLGIAGSALSSIGGPLLKGAVSTLGGLVSNVVGGLFGGGSKGDDNQASAPPATAPVEQAPAIGGDIPVSRYLSLLKTLLPSASAENPASNLLLQLSDVISENVATGSGALPATLPMKIMVKMANLLAEREVFNRTSVDLPAVEDVLMLNPSQIGIVIQELSLSNQLVHREIALKLLALVGEKLDSELSLTTSFAIDAKRVLKEDIPLPSSDEVQRITSALLALVPNKN